MGRIIYETATSFDGYLADEQHSLDWLFVVPGGDNPDLAPPRAAVQVMGSTTYEWVLDELGALENMNVWHETMPSTTVVFTTRQLPAPDDADVKFMSGDVADAVPELQRLAGEGNIWVVGGGGLASQFIAAQALDEMVFSVAPVALGAGAPLLSQRIESDQATLISVEQVGQFARLTYRLSYPNKD
ncbi:dihydrofolate reductase family protein [Enteractinococcus fodinae]|uniref:Dihydrofolate reductase n=1 Tax=Enteractinococcus fodinae TaxID=684663 RepID=A0ABU2AXM3_9MICC|nr:dihydrofolate reductase family protein [Enteractinococcus fodinae]MDR7346093.1 dihydrofolate reductase [Enteractinococcus fodinae]